MLGIPIAFIGWYRLRLLKCEGRGEQEQQGEQKTVEHDTFMIIYHHPHPNTQPLNILGPGAFAVGNLACTGTFPPFWDC